MGADFRVAWAALLGVLVLLGLQIVAGHVRVTPGLYIKASIQGQSNKFLRGKGSHPNLRLFAAMEDLFGRPWRCLDAAR